MPEPERDIEKRLEAYAEKRRQEAGAPLELHPATRRMLQGEVSRRKAKAAGDVNWFARVHSVCRSRWAIAAGVAVLIVAALLVVPLVQPAKKEMALALLEEKDALTKAKSGVTDNQPAPASRAESDTIGRQRRDQDALFDSVRVGNAVTVAGSEATVQSLEETPKVLAEPKPAAIPTFAGDKAISGDLRELAAPPAAPPATTSFSFGAITNSTPVALAAPATPAAMIAQNFAQVAKQKAPGVLAGSNGPQNVLNNFRVEQSRDKLQIIDSDGSTYIGYVQPAKEQEELSEKKLGLTSLEGDGTSGIVPAKPALKEAADQELAKRNRAPDQQVAPAMQNYFFRVSGTNHALNQQVVFTGNLTTDTNWVATGGAQAPGQDAPQPSAAASTKQFQNLQWRFQNSRINGTAVVGESQKLDIDAVAVPTP